jgi:hypothetical protein
MKACLIKAQLWDESVHEEALNTILQECQCNLAKKPQLHPRVSLSTVQKGEELCMDVIYLEGIPHLHMEDKYTALSSCCRLENRQISTQVDTLSRIWIQPRGSPRRITADPEYDKLEFRAYCDSIGCELVIVATEAHHQNGTIEAGNRILRMFFRRIRMAEKQMDLPAAVESAVYGKNCCTGSKGASSYELWFGISPGEPDIPATLRAAYDARQARSKVFRAIKPGHRPHDDIHVGEYVRFFREKKGWSTACLVVSVSKNIITIIHNNVHKTAARSSVMPCDPPFEVFLDPDDCPLEAGPALVSEQEDEFFDVRTSEPESEHSTENPATEDTMIRAGSETAPVPTPDKGPLPDDVSETGPRDVGNAVRHPGGRGSSRVPSDRVLRPRDLDSQSRTHNYTTGPSAAREIVEFGATHFATTMPFTQSSTLASSEEMAEAYLKERQNWSEARAFRSIAQTDLPSGANVIGSHVIYKYKPDGSLKARIVPHGHMDDEKAFVRTDAPTMSVEVMRLLLSIAVEHGWRIGSLDVKAAYLQADGFNRDIFVRPPREEADSRHLWRLEKPAYGIVESGRLWFLTAFRALESFDLRPCPYDKTLFKLDDSSLLVTTQVDNFIFTGTHEPMERFAAYMARCFKLSELEYDNFFVYGTQFSRDPRGVHINQGAKINELIEYPLVRDRRRMHDEPVTRSERLFYMSTVGSMLFVGRVTSPIVARIATVLACALPHLTVKDVKVMNAAIRKLKASQPAIAELHFLAPDASLSDGGSTLLVFTDASFNDDISKNRAGVLVTRSFGLGRESPAHVIDFCSHKLRRVARSTKTAETLAASEGFDRGYYVGALLAWMGMNSGIFLVLDNSSLYADVSTTRAPKEKRVKVDLALLRESFENGDLGAVIWADTTAQLADAMTKADEKADLRLLLALGEGVLRHPYLDCAVKISPRFSDLNGAKGGVVRGEQRRSAPYTQLTA